jgi:4-aminobutyrate aminotransferase-like enzyme/Ser/Thr protein kinase RdoA (MazF antagonist)
LTVDTVALFGIEGQLTPLAGERDRNFRLVTPGGERYVLKLHHDGDGLDLQDAALGHLGGRVPAPRLAGRDGLARLLTWVQGRPWPEVEPTPERMRALGRTVATVDAALAGFEHPEMKRPHRWNVATAPEAAQIELEHLPHQVIHNDANEHNVLVDGDAIGLIDFGDIVWAPRVCGLAVACAYAGLGHADPLRAVLPLVRGYDEAAPLHPAELAVLFPLIRARLEMSARLAAEQHAREPHNDYLLISQQTVGPALRALRETDAGLAHFRLRDAVGFEAVPHARAVRQYFESGRARTVTVLDEDVATAPAITFDITGEAIEADPLQRVADAGVPFGIGRYGEPRHIYTAEQFRQGEPRTIHLGCDLFQPAGARIHAPLPGTVVHSTYNPLPLDYGGVAIVEHATDDGVPFFTLYGHMDPESLAPPGTRLEPGDVVGELGAPDVNGGWPPHVHFQLLTHLAGMGTDVYGVAPASEADLWKSISPDPNLILRRPEGITARTPRARAAIAARRRTNLSRALSLAYDEPLEIVRGAGAHLYDAQGRPFLDLVNNVAHVGHCHPRVVEAGQRQMALLNTNTRYLHPAIAEYTRRLVELMPDPLRVCFLVNSGSEANDLALRLAHAHTGREDVLVLEHGYHGHLSSTVALSPYKFGRDRPPHTHVCALPVGGVDGIASVAERLEGVAPAAFFAEPLQGCGGQVVYPDGYLAEAFALVREAGGVCVADEVQVGLGRVGSHLWGFETQGAAPDVVTLGKPLGNGHPLAAVITTPEIARSFETGMEYFNTFGGNPVSCEVGLAVLDVLRDEGLQARAARRGEQLLAGLRAVGHPAIADVRGLGLFLGVELDTRERAHAVKEALKARGVLISTDGPEDSVLKIKPPLVLTSGDCEHFLDAFRSALSGL